MPVLLPELALLRIAWRAPRKHEIARSALECPLVDGLDAALGTEPKLVARTTVFVVRVFSAS